MPGIDDAALRGRLSTMLDRLSQLRDARTRLAELRVEGEAADGLVGVTVGPTGALAHVRIDPGAMRLDSQTLAQSIMEAARQATARASEMTTELFAGLDSGLDVGSLLTSGATSLPGDGADEAAIERIRGLIS